jgi:hypothetical protein
MGGVRREPAGIIAIGSIATEDASDEFITDSGEKKLVCSGADMPKNSLTESINAKDAAFVPDAKAPADTSTIRTIEIRPINPNLNLRLNVVGEEPFDGLLILFDIFKNSPASSANSRTRDVRPIK